ncbi:hypothetical protein BKA93DRAFT_372223 [Sparassis latifolia]
MKSKISWTVGISTCSFRSSRWKSQLLQMPTCDLPRKRICTAMGTRHCVHLVRKVNLPDGVVSSVHRYTRSDRAYHAYGKPGIVARLAQAHPIEEHLRSHIYWLTVSRIVRATTLTAKVLKFQNVQRDKFDRDFQPNVPEKLAGDWRTHLPSFMKFACANCYSADTTTYLPTAHYCNIDD